MWTHSKDGTTCPYHVFTYMYSLLIEKDILDRRNISNKFPCVCVCFSSRDLFIFGKSFPFLFPFLCYPHFGGFLSTWSVICFRMRKKLQEDEDCKMFQERILQRVSNSMDENSTYETLFRELVGRESYEESNLEELARQAVESTIGKGHCNK